jgi:hypothetical protein
MKIYIFVDKPDLGDKESEAIVAIGSWVTQSNLQTIFVNERQPSNGWKLGIELEIKSSQQLISPLNHFYQMAKQYKCDFVVGFFVGNEQEDVCYFGHEEGKADAYEVGCYLGFES